MTLTLLEHFVIYERPLDAPHDFVVRRWVIHPGGDPVPTHFAPRAPTLEEARALVPPGFACIPRHPTDDVTIVETWI